MQSLSLNKVTGSQLSAAEFMQVVNRLNDITPSETGVYPFKATAGADVTTSLQAALNTYKNVSIDQMYRISTSLIIPTDGSLIGTTKFAGLKAAETRTGLLSERSIYIDVISKNNVTIKGIKFQPADNMTSYASYPYGASHIWVRDGSAGTVIENCNFDFNWSYGYGPWAIFVTGAGTDRTIIRNNYCKTVGITPADTGASFGICENNAIINASANAIGLVGNDANNKCENNIIQNNYIENAGRMGIEEIQSCHGTVFRNNVVNGCGYGLATNPEFSNAQIAISCVAESAIVEGNTTKGLIKGYHIEVRGKSNHRILNNNCFGNYGNHTTDNNGNGIYINFLSNVETDLIHQNTLIRGNKVVGCFWGLATFGGGVQPDTIVEAQPIGDIIENTVIDAYERAVYLELKTALNASISIKDNLITYTTNIASHRNAFLIVDDNPTKLIGTRYGRVTIEGNVVNYLSSVENTGYDTIFNCKTDNITLKNNRVLGYPTTHIIPFETYAPEFNAINTPRKGYIIEGNVLSNMTTTFNFRGNALWDALSNDRIVVVPPKTVAKTATYTAGEFDDTINCTANTFTVTLWGTEKAPANREYLIINSGSGTITVAVENSGTINGLGYYTLAAGKYVRVKNMPTGAAAQPNMNITCAWTVVGNN